MKAMNLILLQFVVFGVIGNGACAGERIVIKAGYLPVSTRVGIVSKMRDAGLNAVWPKITSFPPSGESEQVLRRLQTWCEACEKNDLQLWPVINFAGGPNELDSYREFRREVTIDGITMPHTPCPVDETYWRKVIFPRCVKLAELSKTKPSLAGVVLDLEMYGADHAGYTSACACGACRRGAGSSRPNALLEWQRREVQRITHTLERTVHDIAPNFQFAAMHLEEPFAFHEGVALGLGTAEVPVVAAAERTYAAGYTSEVDETRERFRRIKAHVQYVGGLSLTHFASEQVAPQLYAFGRHGDGYWLYTLASLAVPNDQVAETYRVADPQEQYWSAFRSASDELSRFAAGRSNYLSPLVAQLKPPEARATLSKRILEPVGTVVPSLPLAGEETRLRRANTAFVLLKDDETLRLSVQGIQISKQQAADGEIKVLDPDRREVTSRKVPLGQTEEIEWVAKSSGTHSVITSFGLNACELRIVNPRVVFFAGLHQRLKVHRVVRPLFFVVPDDRAQINVLTENPGESLRIRVRDTTGNIVEDKVVSGSASLTANGRPGIWSMTLEGEGGRAFGGVQFGLSPPLAPYVADAPERLLRDKSSKP